MHKIDCISLETMQRSQPPTESVLCLGNFDGVHLAHRTLLRRSETVRNEQFPSASTAVFCFYLPSFDFVPGRTIGHLCTLTQKLELFRQEGIEYAFLTDFPSVQYLSPEAFAELIKKDCHCVATLCGFNYRFGMHGTGSARDLHVLTDLPTFIQDEVRFEGATVSSTRIRQLLTEGRVEEANKLLCRPFSFSAEVVHGKALGKRMNAPTINQDLPAKMLIPRHGVYITDCTFDGMHFTGVTNIGYRPTVDHDHRVNCETYLLDFNGDLYEKKVTVSFLRFLRDEKNFESQDALQSQIQQDIFEARAFMN